MMKKIFCFTLTIFLISGVAFAGAINLPQTGQTKCWDQYGSEIPCAGTGQDGDIKAGVAWPEPRFTDNGDATVTDNLTGLVWAQDGNLMHTRNPELEERFGGVAFQNALDYLTKLNDESYCGKSDWRLPNVNELESLFNANEPVNADWLSNQGFINAQALNYWASTTNAANTYNAWTIDMGINNGCVTNYGIKTGSNLVWPVRSGEQCDNAAICLPRTGQSTCYDKYSPYDPIICAGTGQDGDTLTGVAWPQPRFTDNGDTVTDNLTGLIWTKNANVPGDHKTWQEALDYVKGMNTGTNPNFGYTDWHLPNRKEIYSLIDFSQSNPALPANYPFTNVKFGDSDCYWSSTSHTSGQYASDAWYVYMLYGTVSFTSKTLSYNLNFVWPVRTGQPAPSGCSTWTDVITKYNSYVSGSATWTDVINCYGEYAK